MRTKADQLRLAIAYALRDLKIQGRKGVLTEVDRYAIADAVIIRLTQSGDAATTMSGGRRSLCPIADGFGIK
jgi:hypothetical protein